MCSIRRIKKAMKNSNSFFTIAVKGEECYFCVNESMEIAYHKKGVQISYEYIPYKAIKKIV